MNDTLQLHPLTEIAINITIFIVFIGMIPPFIDSWTLKRPQQKFVLETVRLCLWFIIQATFTYLTVESSWGRWVLYVGIVIFAYFMGRRGILFIHSRGLNAALSVALIIPSEDGEKILMKRRKDGRYSFFAGGIEPGELPKDAVIREWEQESSFPGWTLEILSFFREFHARTGGGNHAVGYVFIGRVKSVVELTGEFEFFSLKKIEELFSEGLKGRVELIKKGLSKLSCVFFFRISMIFSSQIRKENRHECFLVGLR